MQVPKNIKIYHIVHIDRLRSILQSGGLYCDAHVVNNALPGTTIGISRIKEQRRTHSLTSYPKLCRGLRAVLLLSSLGHAVHNLEGKPSKFDISRRTEANYPSCCRLKTSC